MKNGIQKGKGLDPGVEPPRITICLVPPPPGLKQILSANRSRTMFDVCERLDPVLCPYCPYLLATLRLRGRLGRDGCESALWDCFKGTNLPPC